MVYNSSAKAGTGAHLINDLVARKLSEHGADVRGFYPKYRLLDEPTHFKGINNILFFYSLLERRKEVLSCDVIQGTTYTPLAFLRFGRPVVSHFGSTTAGFLNAVPRTHNLDDECRGVMESLFDSGAIRELNIRTRRPMEDIAGIERYAAKKADRVVATSDGVARELRSMGVHAGHISVVHNAVDDAWLRFEKPLFRDEPSLVFLGRIGESPFDLKLKGVDRLLALYRRFPEARKVSFMGTGSPALAGAVEIFAPNHHAHFNHPKERMIPSLRREGGGVALVTSRYEGFSLSLVEAMSQGLVPVTFPVGVAPEIVEDGRNGFVVRSLDEASDRIRELFSDRRKRRRMALNAFRTAKAFRGDVMAERMMAVYRELVR